MAGAVGLLLLTAGCAGAPVVDDNRGAPIDARIVRAASAAGFADCDATGARGDLAEISLTCLTTGEPAPLAVGGRPTVVNVWASWCVECRTETPLLAQAAERFAGVRFVGIVFADRAPMDAVALARGSGATYMQYADTDSFTKLPLRLRGLPQTVFIAADGTIAGVVRTAFRTREDVDAAIEKYLGVTP